MIQGESIRKCIQEELSQRGLFLVDVTVRPGNRITVFVDSMQGVTLEECISVSRFIESKFDREAEDFELEVSSPGLDSPLKLPQQYQKNMGRILEVITFDGMKTTGKLVEAGEELIRLELETMEKDSKTRKKVKVIKTWERKIDEIKSARVAISLKNKK
jgi:ribosome maturation factor RimP